MIRVTVWNEFVHEKTAERVKQIYPNGIHEQIKNFLKDDFEVRTATLDDEECGLTKEVIDNTDVLIWWGHAKHDSVPDEVVERVYKAVITGMGLIVLHSGHHSKIFTKLTGMPCNLCWREDGDKERIWVVNPSHPIAKGLGRYFELEHEEMYGEPFVIPEPDETLFLGWYEGGECFRSGVTYRRGYGKIFYFQPGHESYPTYHNKDVQTVIKNAIEWANPSYRNDDILIGPRVKMISEN